MSNLVTLKNFKKHETCLALSTKNMSRQQWLEARKTGIGGSDISAIMGVNPYATALMMFMSAKRSQRTMTQANTLIGALFLKMWSLTNSPSVTTLKFRMSIL